MKVLFVGISAMVLAVFGFWYNCAMTYDLLSQWRATSNDSLISMSIELIAHGICLLFSMGIFLCGIHLSLGRLHWSTLLTRILYWEVAYYIATIFAFFLYPVLGMGACLSGVVSTGCIVLQFITLFPFWAPTILWRAIRESSQRTSIELVDPLSPIYSLFAFNTWILERVFSSAKKQTMMQSWMMTS